MSRYIIATLLVLSSIYYGYTGLKYTFSAIELKTYSILESVSQLLDILMVISFICAILVFFFGNRKYILYIGLAVLLSNIIFMIPAVKVKIMLYKNSDGQTVELYRHPGITKDAPEIIIENQMHGLE